MTTRKITQQILFVSAVLLTLGNCSYEFPEPPVIESGSLESADISNTVFIGGTLFSGVHNGALTTDFSQFSIPQIYLNNIKGNSFESWESFSPSVETTNGFNIYENVLLSENIGQYDLIFPNKDTTDFKRINTEGEAFAYSNVGGSIQNFSFPEANISDITSANSDNPFVQQFNLGGQSVVERALAQNPTFFALNLGFEDILAFAMSGGEGNGNVNDLANFNRGDLLSESLFEAKVDEVVDAFLQVNQDTKGAIFNIPYLLNFPFFIELGFDLTPFVNQTPLLNDIRSEASIYNQSLENYYRVNPTIPFDDRRPPLDFAADRAGNWGILVIDETLGEATYANGRPMPKVRHMQRGELVFLPTESLIRINQGHFPSNALGEDEYLDADEVELIAARILAFNQILADKVAQSNGRLTLIDTNSYFETLYDGLNIFLGRKPNGIDIEGVNFFPGISKFGIFSADGVNLNPRGNALLTSVMIESLIATFGGDLRNVDPNAFRGTPITPSTDN